MSVRPTRSTTMNRVVPVLVALVCSVSPGQSGTAPRLECSESTFNFGTRQQGGTPVEHTFTLTNSGTGALEIGQVTPLVGCSCRSLAIVGKKNLEPGEQTRVEVRMPADKPPGEVSEVWVVESNDPDRPKLQLAVKGLLVRTFEVSPPSITFEKLTPADQASRTVEVNSGGMRAFGITGIDSVPQGFKITTERVSEYQYRVTASTQPPLTYGKLTATVRLRTDNPELGEIEIPFSADIPSAMLLVPGELSFKSQSGGGEVSVALCSNDQAAFKVLDIQSPSPELEVHCAKLDEHSYLLNVKATALGLALDGSSIRLKTDHPDATEIRIPVRIR